MRYLSKHKYQTVLRLIRIPQRRNGSEPTEKPNNTQNRNKFLMEHYTALIFTIHFCNMRMCVFRVSYDDIEYQLIRPMRKSRLSFEYSRRESKQTVYAAQQACIVYAFVQIALVKMFGSKSACATHLNIYSVEVALIFVCSYPAPSRLVVSLSCRQPCITLFTIWHFVLWHLP